MKLCTFAAGVILAVACCSQAAKSAEIISNIGTLLPYGPNYTFSVEADVYPTGIPIGTPNDPIRTPHTDMGSYQYGSYVTSTTYYSASTTGTYEFDFTVSSPSVLTADFSSPAIIGSETASLLANNVVISNALNGTAINLTPGVSYAFDITGTVGNPTAGVCAGGGCQMGDFIVSGTLYSASAPILPPISSAPLPGALPMFCVALAGIGGLIRLNHLRKNTPV